MYHYIESGLDNIYLKSGVAKEKSPYGETVSIHHMDELHMAIGMAIATSLHRMSGKELRFLRVEMNLSQKRLGELIHMSSQQIARWEKGESDIQGPAELLIRRLYIEHAGSNTKLVRLCEDLAELDEIEFAERREFVSDHGDWRLAG